MGIRSAWHPSSLNSWYAVAVSVKSSAKLPDLESFLKLLALSSGSKGHWPEKWHKTFPEAIFAETPFHLYSSCICTRIFQCGKDLSLLLPHNLHRNLVKISRKDLIAYFSDGYSLVCPKVRWPLCHENILPVITSKFVIMTCHYLSKILKLFHKLWKDLHCTAFSAGFKEW